MGSIVWKGLHAWVRPGLGFEVVEHTDGWRVYVCGDPMDRVDYGSEGAAKQAAEAVVDTLEPRPAPKRRERRRPIVNEGPQQAPHPGQLRKPPKR